jgi:hypothetical protein
MAVLYNCPRYPLRTLSIVGAGLIAASIAGFAIVGTVSAPSLTLKYVPPLMAAAGIFTLSASIGGSLAFRVVAAKTPRPDYTSQVEVVESGA